MYYFSLIIVRLAEPRSILSFVSEDVPLQRGLENLKNKWRKYGTFKNIVNFFNMTKRINSFLTFFGSSKNLNR